MTRSEPRRPKRPARPLAVGFAVAMTASLAGCAMFGHHGEGPGANAYPDNYKADLLAFMQTYLNDPTNVRDAQIADPVLTQVNSTDRYVVCIKFNARNTEGRYLGAKQSMA